MAPPILKLDDIHLGFGGAPLLVGAALQIEPGARIGLVGRNGSGKSTLMKIAAGLMEPQSGTVFRHPGATLRYLRQAPDFGDAETVRAYAEAGLGPADDRHRVAYLLDALGLSETADPARLSGGEARRAALARVLAPAPDILLLDEPTNHLDLPAIEWLEGELDGSNSAMVLISHDRRFLQRLSRVTVWIDRGMTRRLDMGFAHFEDWRDQVLEAEESEMNKLARAIAREEDWMRYGVTARRKRNMRRVGELQAMRAKKRGHRGPTGTVSAAPSQAAASGRLVIEAAGLHKSLGGRCIVRDVTLRVHRGDRIGLIGANGSGKTTLLKMLVGALAPDSGTIRLGTNLQVAVLDQKRADLPGDAPLAAFLTDGRGDTLLVDGKERHVTGYMKDFLFQPEQARTPIRSLSGGEKARLVLARLLARPANLLVLDEPTNDLDMETLDLLQEIVAGFAGTVILVSHDRDFLDRTVTSIVAPARPNAPDGRWIEYAGGYTDMLAQRRGEDTTSRTASGRAARSGEDRAKTDGALQRRDAGRRKLSYKQKHALETLPDRIAETQRRIADLEKQMSDPQLYARAPDTFHAAAERLSVARSHLIALEDEWLALEMLREEIESQR